MEKIFITKYALTYGIKEIEAKITPFDREGGKTAEYAREPGGYNSYVIGNEAFRSLGEAKMKAEEMRKRKIESLKKQIAKMEKIKF